MGITCQHCGDIPQSNCELDYDCPHETQSVCDTCDGVFEKDNTELCDGEQFDGCGLVLCNGCLDRRRCDGCRWGFCENCSNNYLAKCGSCSETLCRNCRKDDGYGVICCETPAFG